MQPPTAATDITTATADGQPGSSGGDTTFLTPVTVGTFFVGLGLAGGAAAAWYTMKVRKNPGALAKGVLGGVSISTVMAAMGTKVAGVFPLTWAEAAVLTGSGFLVGVSVGLIAICLGIYLLIVKPLCNRFSRPHGVRVIVELLTGIESLRTWVQHSLAAIAADESWDEFASAVLTLQERLSMEREEGFFSDFMTAYETPALDRADPVTIKFISRVLSPPVEQLTSRLVRTNLHFTLWRVAANEDSLEHLVSLPSETNPSYGRGTKEPLPIYVNRESGSLAARAMLRRRYEFVKASGSPLPRRWPRRSLGKTYDAVAAMPVPCDGSEAPWAVICMEVRGGTISIESRTMQHLLGLLSGVVLDVQDRLKKRDIEEVPNQATDNSNDGPRAT
ncbi:MAG: hypothetical protein H7Y88_03630 [Phycisphaerales bacterium]|nr:hypothetical protein [Phycisphaerales bacterium]